jgi:uncharacterized RmlC-like cupin family protein
VSSSPQRAVSTGGTVAKIIPAREVLEQRGVLRVAQFPDQLPFVATRFFTVSNVPVGERRGQHAHRECHQVLATMAGRLTADVWDSVGHRQFELEPGKVLYVPPMIFGGQKDFSPDAVLLVLASHPYDADDYIASFDEFCDTTGYRYDAGQGQGRGS